MGGADRERSLIELEAAEDAAAAYAKFRDSSPRRSSSRRLRESES